jgi:serine-type D-Ala-D-Ala endopeptidase (penicillin-binding protein 7)
MRTRQEKRLRGICLAAALLLAMTCKAHADQGVQAEAAKALDLRSAAALVFDQRNGRTLYAKNPELHQPIASITKLMTAMVVLDAQLLLDERILISPRDVDHLKYTHSRLGVGMALTRLQLLHLALIASENRAAAALARTYPGGSQSFVAAMNAKAKELGMSKTEFVDSTGLSSNNRSCAEDLVKLVGAAYRYPLIRSVSTTPSYSIPSGKKGRRSLVFSNTNGLVASKDWNIGVSKTGYISESGHCLVMQAKIAEQGVIIVLLDALGKWSRTYDAKRIRQWLEGQIRQENIRLSDRGRNV